MSMFDSDNKFFQGENTLIEKGEDINLTQKDPTLKESIVAVGWDARGFEGETLDMDFSCFLLNKDGITREDSDFVFYNNFKGSGGAVRHTGDSRTGAGDGDDETIYVDLNGIPFDVMAIVFVLSIYEGEYLDEEINFKRVRNVYFRLVNLVSGDEVLRYQLDAVLEDHPHGTAMILAAITRDGPVWHFKALGEYVDGGLAAIATQYGIMVQELQGT